MSDQNLEYKLDVLTEDANYRMLALFSSWEKAGREASTSFGKGLTTAAKKAKAEAKEASDGFYDLEKAITKAEKSAGDLVNRYAGINPQIDASIAKLRTLIDTSKAVPEVMDIRSFRDSTLAGRFNKETQEIVQQIKASVALANQQKKQQADADAYVQASIDKQILQKRNIEDLIRLQNKAAESLTKLANKAGESSPTNKKKILGLQDGLEEFTKSLYDKVGTKSGMQEAKRQLSDFTRGMIQEANVFVAAADVVAKRMDTMAENKRIKAAETKALMDKELSDRIANMEAAANAVARFEAEEKRREQEAVNRYKVAQEAGAKRRAARLAEDKAEQEAFASAANMQNSVADAAARADEKLRKQAKGLREAGFGTAAQEVERLRTALAEVAKTEIANIGMKGRGDDTTSQTIKAAYAQSEALQDQARASTKSAEANAKAVTQQNALWKAVNTADESLRKQAQSFRDLNNAGAAEEVEKLRTKLQEVANIDMSKIGNKGTLLPTQNVDKFMADNRLLIQGYDEQIKKETEVEKTSAASHEERIRQAEKLNSTEAQIRATRYSDNAQFQAAVKAQEAETSAFLDNLRTRSVGMTKSQIESEIVEHQRLAAAKISLAAEAAQAQVNAEFARVTAMNKASMAVFAVQQAVEDYSYAGLRGAMNNLSMLAMMVGGAGGLAALFGVMALNVAHSSGALDKLADALGIAGRKTKEEADEINRLVEAMSHLQQLQFDSKQQAMHFDPAAADVDSLTVQRLAKENDIRLEKERGAAASKAVLIYKEMEQVAKGLGSYADLGWSDFGFKNEDAETVLKNIDLIRQEGEKVIAARYGLMNTPEKASEIKWFNEQLDKMVELDNQFRSLSKTMATAEGFKEVQKNSEESTKKLRELEQAARDLSSQLSLVSKLGLTPQGLKDLESHKFSTSGESYSGSAGEYLSKVVQEQQTYYARRQVELEHERAMAIEEAAGNEQKKLDAIQRYVDALSLEARWGDIAVKNAEANAAAHEKTTKALEEAERSIKNQISDTERLIEASEKQLQNTLEQKSAWEDSEAKRKAASLDKIDDLKLQEKQEAIDKKLKEGPGGLEWAKQRKEYLKDLAKYQLDTMKQQNGNGKGAYDPDKQLQKEYDSYINNLDREYEAYVKHLERKAEADKLAAEKATNAEKQKRLDQLKEELGGKAQDTAAKAAQLQAEGKWEQAKSEMDKSMKALKELHDAQQKAIGKTTSEQSIQAEKEMEATNKKINAMYDSMAALETARQAQAKQQLIEQQAIQQDIINKKAQAASIDMANPKDVETINALNASLERTLALMQAIKSVQAIGASPVAARAANGAGGGQGGAAGGVGNTSINITTNMAGGSPMSANLAAAAAAQNLLIMRR